MGLSEIAPPSASVSRVHSCLLRCSEERSSWLASKDLPSDAAVFGPDLPRSGLVPPLPFLPASAACSAGHLSGLLHPETDHGVHQVSEPSCSARSVLCPLTSRSSRLPWTHRLHEVLAPNSSARPFPGVWSPCGALLPLGCLVLPFREALGCAAASASFRAPRGVLVVSLPWRGARRKHMVLSHWCDTLRSLPLVSSRALAGRSCLVGPRVLRMARRTWCLLCGASLVTGLSRPSHAVALSPLVPIRPLFRRRVPQAGFCRLQVASSFPRPQGLAPPTSPLQLPGVSAGPLPDTPLGFAPCSGVCCRSVEVALHRSRPPRRPSGCRSSRTMGGLGCASSARQPELALPGEPGSGVVLASHRPPSNGQRCARRGVLCAVRPDRLLQTSRLWWPEGRRCVEGATPRGWLELATSGDRPAGLQRDSVRVLRSTRPFARAQRLMRTVCRVSRAFCCRARRRSALPWRQACPVRFRRGGTSLPGGLETVAAASRCPVPARFRVSRGSRSVEQSAGWPKPAELVCVRSPSAPASPKWRGSSAADPRAVETRRGSSSSAERPGRSRGEGAGQGCLFRPVGPSSWVDPASRLLLAVWPRGPFGRGVAVLVSRGSRLVC